MTDNSKALYRRIWEEAGRLGIVKLYYPDEKDAARMRMNLYSAVQKNRKNIALDPDFHNLLATLECVVVKDGKGGAHVVLRHYTMNPLLCQAAAQLDMLIAPDSKQMEESEARLRESLSPDAGTSAYDEPE